MLNWINVEKSKNDYKIFIPRNSAVKLDLNNVVSSTIEHIHQNYPPPYTLYVSGGIDSQAMLWAWHMSKKPFKAVSYVYNNGMNSHDLEKGMPDFIKNLNVDIEYRQIDLLNFYKDIYSKYHERYRCGSPQVCAYMYMADQQREGTVIFSGSNFGFYTKNEWGLYNYGTISKKNIVPFFFSETSEIHYYSRSITKNNSDKIARYNKLGFPVIDQGPGETGTSGFEQIKNFYDQEYTHLVTNKLKFSRLYNQRSSRTYDILLRNHLEVKYNDKYEIYYV